MMQCIQCREVKFWFSFPSIAVGYYTSVSLVCRKCAKRLMWQAIDDAERAERQGKR